MCVSFLSFGEWEGGTTEWMEQEEEADQELDGMMV